MTAAAIPTRSASEGSIRLKVLLPFRVFAERQDIQRIIAETPRGSFGILPHRLDCVAVLTAGILTYQAASGQEVYVAVDEGVLVKVGMEVLVSVRNAIAGTDLGKLRESVEREFLNLDEREKNIRRTLAQLESGLVRRLAELQHE